MADFLMNLFYFTVFIVVLCLTIAAFCLIAWLVVEVVLDISDQLKQRKEKSK